MRFRIKLSLLAGVALIFSACSATGPGRVQIADSKSYEASLFRQNCAICHGPEAEGRTLDDGLLIPNLRGGEYKYKTAGEIRQHITDGGNGMVPFRDQLTQREIDMLVDFVLNELRRENRLR